MKSRIFIWMLVLGLSACLETNTPSKLEQLHKEIEEIDAYLVANPPDPSDLVIKDATGVTLVISELGTGTIPPNQDNELVVTYTGRLFSNGQVFDSRDLSDPFYFIISETGVIEGWKIVLSMMTEGTVARAYIPSVYGYGSGGSGSVIPGNAILIFDMKLESVEPTAAQITQLNSQVFAIDEKIDIAGTENVIEHESGIRIVHTQIGSGLTPTLYNQVVIRFSGRLLTDDTEILPLTERGPSSDYSSRVINYLHGLMIGLQQMQVGGKATIYVPAILAYGPVAFPGIPANSNLIYEVELLEVIE